MTPRWAHVVGKLQKHDILDIRWEDWIDCLVPLYSGRRVVVLGQMGAVVSLGFFQKERNSLPTEKGDFM